MITILLLGMTAGGIYAYKALTSIGEVTVKECLSFVGPNTFLVTLYPGESDSVQLIVANTSSVDIDVDIVSIITPDPGLKGLTVSIPKKIIAPAKGQVIINIIIAASKSAEPSTYNITIEFNR